LSVRTPALAAPPSSDSQTLARGINVINAKNPQISIPFTVAGGSDQRVVVKIYDREGQVLKNLMDSDLPAGAHVALWNGDTDSGDAAGSGTYWMRINMRNSTSSKPLVIIR